MDSIAYTLILALGAALCAALISGWLLYMMVPGRLFWCIVITDVLSAPIGLFLPSICRRQREQLMPTANIFSASVVSMMACIAVIIIADKATATEMSWTYFASDLFMRKLISVSGVSMASSLAMFLLHYVVIQEVDGVRRFGRKVRKMSRWAPSAKIVICDDLASSAPGECAICLESLGDLPAELAVALPPSRRRQSKMAMNKIGLLRLPCQHTFHGTCADRWIDREVTCPMCRKAIGSLSNCSRLCLRASACSGQQLALQPSRESGGRFHEAQAYLEAERRSLEAQQKLSEATVHVEEPQRGHLSIAL